MDKILVIISGVSAIVFVYWFFLMRKEVAVAGRGTLSILVDGGYSPEVISMKKDETLTLSFLRKDPSNCLDEVVFPELKKSLKLPLNKEVSLQIHPTNKGVYEFHCGMNMFHGKVIVE